MEITHVRNEVTAQDLTSELEYGEVVSTVTPIVSALNSVTISLDTIEAELSKLQAFANGQGGPPLVQGLRAQVAAAIPAFENNLIMTTQTQAPTEDGGSTQTVTEDIYSDSGLNNPITYAQYMANPNQTAYCTVYTMYTDPQNPDNDTWEAVTSDGQSASSLNPGVTITSSAVAAMQGVLNFINSQ